MLCFADTFPPKVTGPTTLIVTYQEQQSFQIVASSNTSSTLTYAVETNGTNVEVDPISGNVTWNINSTDFRLKFLVTDSNNNTAALSPTVTLCYCLNNALCNSSISNEITQPLNNLLTYAACTCTSGFTGAFCQESISYCLEDPCFEGVNCTNNVTTRSAVCDSCPTGYEGDGRKCFGINFFLFYSCIFQTGND